MRTTLRFVTTGLLVVGAACETRSFWCRKLGVGARQCMTDRVQCEDSEYAGGKCFDQPTAHCFTAETSETNGGGVIMICSPTPAECDDWYRRRAENAHRRPAGLPAR